MALPWWRRIAFPASAIGSIFEEDARSIVEKYGFMAAPYFMVEISSRQDSSLYSAASFSKGEDELGYDLNGLIVSDVTWEEDIEGADSLNFTVNNPDNNLQNSILFEEGNNVDLFMGYDGHPPFFMGRGIIVEKTPSFSSGAMSTMRVVCYDKSYFMMEEGRAEISRAAQAR